MSELSLLGLDRILSSPAPRSRLLLAICAQRRSNASCGGAWQVLGGVDSVDVACEFSGAPPAGGTFALGLNGRPLYLTANREIRATLPVLVAGMWHSVHCMVLDAAGRAVASANNTFVVRPGSGEGAADVSAVMGDPCTAWRQHHDACGAEQSHPLRPAANSSGQERVAARSWDRCCAAACGAADAGGPGCHIEGLVDKDTHYPPHAAKLLEEHFYHYYVSSAARFPPGIEFVPVVCIVRVCSLLCACSCAPRCLPLSLSLSLSLSLTLIITLSQIMWISHMHNMQLHRLTYRPTEDDLVAHILDRSLYIE